MEKRISFDQFQSVKRVAQACNPLMVKREKIKSQINKLAEEYKSYDTQIAALEAGIKQVVGFRVEELVKKVIEPGVDINGQPKKTTKYVPTDMVTYDAEKKQYVLTLPTPPSMLNNNENIKESENLEVQPTEEPSSENTPSEESVPASEEIPTDAPIFD